MKQKGSLLIIVIIVLAIIGIAAAYYFGTQSTKTEAVQTPPPSPTPVYTFTPTSEVLPTEPVEESTLPAGWSTYVSTEYGFEISYSSNYQALDDSENLYGWPNGVVLFYKGGQAYDIAVEAWNIQAEYEAKYGTNNPNLTVHAVGNKFITLLDNSQEAQNSDVIATFTPISP